MGSVATSPTGPVTNPLVATDSKTACEAPLTGRGEGGNSEPWPPTPLRPVAWDYS